MEDSHKPTYKSIFDLMSEEEKEKVVIYKENLVLSYDAIRLNNLAFAEIANAAVYGHANVSSDEKLQKTIGSSLTNREYISKVIEVPILKDVIDRKTTMISGWQILPEMVALAPIKGSTEDVSKTTAAENQLNAAVQFLYTKEMDDYTRFKLINTALIEGAAAVRLSSAGTTYKKALTDVALEVIPTYNLLFDYSKPVIRNNSIAEVQNLNIYELDSYPLKFRELYEGTEIEIEGEMVGRTISEDPTELIPVYTMFFRGNVETNLNDEIIYSAIFFDDVLCDVSETKLKDLPYEVLTLGKNTEFWKNSDVSLCMPTLDLFNRNETGISRLISFTHQPQVEISKGALTRMSFTTFSRGFQAPGFVIPTKDGQSVRVIERKNEVAQLQGESMRLIELLYRIVGMNKTSMGESSGSLTTSTGVVQLTESSQQGIASNAGFMSQFTSSVALMLTRFYVNNYDTLPYLSSDKEGKSRIESLDTEKFKDTSATWVKMNTKIEQVNSQTTLNFLMQMYGMMLQYAAEDPSINAVKPIMFDLIMDEIPMSNDSKMRINNALIPMFDAMAQESYNQGAVDGTKIATTLIEQMNKGMI